MCSGCQPIVSLSASIRSRTSVVRDVPARLRVVEQRRVAAPAVRVGVLVGLGARKSCPLALERRRSCRGSASLTKRPAKPVTRSSKVPSGATGFWRRDRRTARRSAEVVLAEGGRDVDQAGAVVGGDEVAGEDRVAARAVVGDVVERAARRRSPARAEPGKWASDLGALAEHLLDQRLGQDQDLAAEPRPRDVRRSRGRRRPRRCGTASTGSSSRPAAGRRARRRLGISSRRTRGREASRRPRGPRRPGSRARPRARRARCRSAGSRGRPCGPRRGGRRPRSCCSDHQTDSM